MPVLILLLVSWILLDALKRRPHVTPTLTITIIERRDGDDWPPGERRPGPKHEPETLAAKRRAKERRTV